MHLFKRFVATPLLAPGEGGSTTDGAEHDPGVTGADEVDSSMDAAPDEGYDDDGSHAGADDDLDGAQATDDDDEALLFGDESEPTNAGRTAEERLEALSKKHTKLKRRFGKSWTLVKTAKQMGITEHQLASMATKARNYDALARGDAEGQRLLRTLLREEALPSKDKGRDRETVETDDEDLKVPFETESDNGKFFLSEAKRNRQLEGTVKKLVARIDQLEGGVNSVRSERQQERYGQVQQQWKTATAAAVKKLEDAKVPKGVQTIFRDNILMAFDTAVRKGVSVDKIIGHYLKTLGIAPQTAALARSAAQQRMVRNNAQRPRHMAGGPGSATPANDKRPRTMLDVRRKIRASGSTG